MQIQPAPIAAPNWVDGEKILGTAYMPGSGYEPVAARAGLIVKSIPSTSFFRKVFLWMDVQLLNTAPYQDAYLAAGMVLFKQGGQVVAKLPARLGQDVMVGLNNSIHVLSNFSIPTRFANTAAGGRDSVLLSVANPTSNDGVQSVLLTPAFIGVQADEVSFDLEAIEGWQYPSSSNIVKGFRVYLAVESSPFPY